MKHVLAVFENRLAAEAAVDALLAKGFTRDRISVLMSDRTYGSNFQVEPSSKAPEGATVGGIAGGALGALVAGIAAVGSIAVPGLGLLAAGPLVAALAGAGAGAATGGLIGGLVGLGIPEEEARLYGAEIERGGILVGVQAEDRQLAWDARRILDDAGATSVQRA